MTTAIPGHLRVLSKHRTEALNDGIMLMIVLSRIGRRIEAREAERLAHSTDRPFP